MTLEEAKEKYPEIPVGRAKDLRGQTFGKLTVLWRIKSTSSTKWLCKCICGNYCPVLANSLSTNNTKSCGCLKKEAANRRCSSLENHRFGKLLVIEKTSQRNASGHIIYKCLCDCGNICYKSTAQLKNGNTKSCGCLHKERTRKANKKNLVGQKFGKLLVLEDTGITRAESVVYKCLCDCGKTTTVRSRDLITGHTKSCGCYKLEQLSNQRRLKLVNKKFGNLLVLEDMNIKQRDSYLHKCKCDCGNIVYIPTNNLTSGHTQSCGCLKMSHGEQKIMQLLQQNNIKYITQKTFNNCYFSKPNCLLRFDFYIKDSHLIEYDGVQHFKYSSSGWNTKENFEKTSQRDAFKNQWCKDNNIPLIRIPYTHYDDLCIEDLMLETTKFRVV